MRTSSLTLIQEQFEICAIFSLADEKVKEAEEKDQLLELDFVCANRSDMVR